jgi:hypothetical protein
MTTIATIASPHASTGPTKGTVFTYTDTAPGAGTYYYRVLAQSLVGDNTPFALGVGFPWTTIESTPSNLIKVVASNPASVVVYPAVVPPTPPGPGPGPAPATSYTTAFASVSALMAANPQPATPSYVFNGPIRINSNADFNLAHGVKSGMGTPASPYIIENLAIDGTGAGYCIYIGNTTADFIVRNNQLINANGGFV